MRQNALAWTPFNTLQYDGLGWYQEHIDADEEPHPIRPTDAEACVNNADLTVTCHTIKVQLACKKSISERGHVWLSWGNAERLINFWHCQFSR